MSEPFPSLVRVLARHGATCLLVAWAIRRLLEGAGLLPLELGDAAAAVLFLAWLVGCGSYGVGVASLLTAAVLLLARFAASIATAARLAARRCERRMAP